MVKAIQGQFEITVWKNVHSFGNSNGQVLSDELDEICNKIDVPLKPIPPFSGETTLGNLILEGMRKGYAFSEYSVSARLKLISALKSMD